MDVQVEVQFTIEHSIEELQEEFVRKGHFPDWRPAARHSGAAPRYLETRTVSVNLATEQERQAWFIFSIEACGELARRIVIPRAIPSSTKTHVPELQDFLGFCRHCLTV